MAQKIHSNTLLDTKVMTSYVRRFKGNTTMSFKISDKELLEMYNQIWKRVEKLFKIEFDSEPVYGDKDKYIKTKQKKNNLIVQSQIFRAKKFQEKKHNTNVHQ